MNPKKQAQEIIRDFRLWSNCEEDKIWDESTKKCALITLRYIIWAKTHNKDGRLIPLSANELKYWENVESIIETYY